MVSICAAAAATSAHCLLDLVWVWVTVGDDDKNAGLPGRATLALRRRIRVAWAASTRPGEPARDLPGGDVKVKRGRMQSRGAAGVGNG